VDVRRIGYGMRGALLAWIAIAAMVVAPRAARAADDAWSDDVRWISVRAGSARSGARFAPEGGFGYGFGYTWFLAKEVSWSANVQHDLLGRVAGAAEIEVPITVEFDKHFAFSATARPYLGGGWGAIYHKTYRTGLDTSGFRQGIYLATGANAALNASSLIGVDFRIMLEQDTRSINPSFPDVHASDTRWSLKLSYSRML
jgi:hypothetical protein